MTRLPGIRDEASWHRQSPYSWTHGYWTICAVRYRGDITYELWKNSAFVARASDAATLRTIAATLRTIAAAGGAVA